MTTFNYYGTIARLAERTAYDENNRLCLTVGNQISELYVYAGGVRYLLMRVSTRGHITVSALPNEIPAEHFDVLTSEWTKFRASDMILDIARTAVTFTIQ